MAFVAVVSLISVERRFAGHSMPYPDLVISVLEATCMLVPLFGPCWQLPLGGVETAVAQEGLRLGCMPLERIMTEQKCHKAITTQPCTPTAAFLRASSLSASSNFKDRKVDLGSQCVSAMSWHQEYEAAAHTMSPVGQQGENGSCSSPSSCLHRTSHSMTPPS